MFGFAGGIDWPEDRSRPKNCGVREGISGESAEFGKILAEIRAKNEAFGCFNNHGLLGKGFLFFLYFNFILGLLDARPHQW
jgi:hypothetical protein